MSTHRSAIEALQHHQDLHDRLANPAYLSFLTFFFASDEAATRAKIEGTALGRTRDEGVRQGFDLRAGDIARSVLTEERRLDGSKAYRDPQGRIVGFKGSDVAQSRERVRAARRADALQRNAQSNAERGELFQKLSIETLKLAETFFVSQDMGDLALFAGRTLDERATFDRHLWPSEFGFLWLEKPAHVLDLWERQIGTRAILWTQHHGLNDPGMLVMEFGDMTDTQDANSVELLEKVKDPKMGKDMGAAVRQLGRLHLSHYQFIPYGENVGPEMIPAPHKPPVRGISAELLEQRSEHRVVAEPDAPEGEEETWGMQPEAQNARRWILSLLMLLNQTITTSSKHDLMPANPKRARRLKIPAQVTVITLRRKTAEKPQGMSEIEWHHRWVVRGHWRNQPCGPDHPLAQEVEPGKFVAHIWIAPYIKGPDDAPFKITDKVNALVR